MNQQRIEASASFFLLIIIINWQVIRMSVSNGDRISIRAPNPPVEDSVFKQLRLDGRTVIITGGAGGIGYEIARGLAEAGANVSQLNLIRL